MRCLLMVLLRIIYIIDNIHFIKNKVLSIAFFNIKIRLIYKFLCE